jgi:hypothetical protein
LVTVAVIISRMSGLLVLVHESGLQEDMDKWSKERDECRKPFQDKQKRKRMSQVFTGIQCAVQSTL